MENGFPGCRERVPRDSREEIFQLYDLIFLLCHSSAKIPAPGNQSNQVLRLSNFACNSDTSHEKTTKHTARWPGERGTFFGLNLPSHYDLEQEQERLGKKLEREVKVLAAA